MEEMVTTETRAVTAVPDQPDRVRHGRARAVVLVVTGVMIAAAFVLGAVGSQARSTTSDERAHARVTNGETSDPRAAASGRRPRPGRS